MRLFVERARAQLPGFQLTSQNTAAVVRICQRLDGIPLALELAAARVSGLSVEEIAQRLDDRFRLLTTGSRTALPRQQTLRALIDWSYDLLSDAERVLFRRLAVFAGGWTLEAAEAVCADPSPSPPSLAKKGDEEAGRDDILDLQTHLIAKSLVIAETSAGATRDRMLETIRDYARAKSAAQETEQTSARHYDYFVALAERAEPELRGKFLIAWHKRLETDHDNLRAALRWALSQPDANLALRLSGALHEFWMFRNHAAEGQSWYEMALARSDGPCQPLYLAKAYSGAGSMAWMQGNPAQAHQLHTQALHYFEQANDKNGMASSLHNLGTQRWHQGDWEDAEDLATRALRMANEAGDDWLKANILNGLGVIWGARGNDGQALLYYADAVTLARKTGDPLALMFGLHNLGCVAGRQGDFQRAGELLEESSRLAQKIEYSYLIVGNLAERGLLCIRQGDYAAAVPLCRRAAQLAVESMYKELLLRAIEWLAAAFGYQHHFERAARLWGAAAAMREETKTGPGRSDLVIYETAVDYVRAHIGEERLAALLAQGRGMTLEQTLAYALE